jgi:hypothetical protein
MNFQEVSAKLDNIIDRLARIEERFGAHIDNERCSERRRTWLATAVVTISLTAWGILIRKQNNAPKHIFNSGALSASVEEGLPTAL